MFSAGAGQEALDRLSETDANLNSVYTRKLLPLLQTPGLPIHIAARQLRDEVEELALTVGRAQRPAYYDEMRGSFVLVPAPREVLTDVVPILGEAAKPMPPEKPDPQFSGTQAELVKALQVALESHSCRPGPDDGVYGIRSERATILFNLVAPANCGRLTALESIRDAVPTPEWRRSAIENLQVLQSCKPSPACGNAPAQDFYREFAKGCWYHATNAHPNEYATWDQGCDSDGFIDGNGTLTFHYPVPVTGSFFRKIIGPFHKGKISDGTVTKIRVSGTEERSTIRVQTH